MYETMRKTCPADRRLVPALLLFAMVLAVAASPAMAGGFLARTPRTTFLTLDSDRVCSRTAQLAFTACGLDVRDDYWEARAICLNVTDPDEQAECSDDARADWFEGRGECADVREARMELCEALGEDAYDPDFDPELFDDDFTALTTPNPYLPIAIGNVWEYEGGDEMTRVEVFDKTKLIDGVTCIVVNDVVSEDGELIEDTDDWFAHALDGAVHYCGEIARDYEYFEGDEPMEAELVEIDGSFKAGRDGAESGIVMPAMPYVGMTYRQEWALGDAEDAAEVVSTTYAYGDDPELDYLVPHELAELLCDGDCLVTRDFTPLEPDAEELKYYAPGVGMFLEVNVEDGEINQLVGCNFNPVCSGL